MNHIGEIVAGLAFGVLAAVVIVPLPESSEQPYPIPQPASPQSISPLPAKPDRENLPAVVNEAEQSLPAPIVQQQQAIKKVEERLSHIDAQTKRIERKLEALDERTP